MYLLMKAVLAITKMIGADELIKDPDFRPSYADTKTPFDDDYTGGLKNSITSLTQKRNKD